MPHAGCPGPAGKSVKSVKVWRLQERIGDLLESAMTAQSKRKVMFAARPGLPPRGTECALTTGTILSCRTIPLSR